MIKATFAAPIRPIIEARLPDWLEPRWFTSLDEAMALAPDTDIGWFDMYDAREMVAALNATTRLKWLNTIYAGVEWMPKDHLGPMGTIFTNGAGINAITIAEYIVMGMLTIAKGYREVVRAQDCHDWLQGPPGRGELADGKALILGGGAIGGLVATRLAAFDVEVTMVRRTPGPGMLGPDDWRARLGEFDWVILTVPATPETERMIGAAELAAMKASAVLINVARGSVIDQPALVDALASGDIAAALLDVTTPEPLPANHPLWDLPNAHITMHLSGQSQSKGLLRGAERFLTNLERWRAGEPLLHVVNLDRGY